LILLIDNYDSFTYNLYQYLSELGAQVIVKRNDQFSVIDAQTLNPDRIVISPGPCTPAEAGVSNEIIRNFSGKVPILGVCLGHQCIGYTFGARVEPASEIMHGKTSAITHDGKGVFNGLPNPLVAIRYHSLAINPEGLPGDLEISAWSDTGIPMGIRHRRYPIEGVQFHPESILTETGKALLDNFLTQVG